MITTTAHAYNQAKRDISQYSNTVTLSEIKAFCEADPQQDNCPELDCRNAHCPELNSDLFFLSKIAGDAMERAGIADNVRNRKTLEGFAYNNNAYTRAFATAKKYEAMLADGWTPIQDTTADMHGKKSHMVGESSGIMGTTKIDEKITIVHDSKYQGYRKARQRTRYYVPAFDSQLFIKLI